MNEVEKLFSELPSEDKKGADIFESPKVVAEEVKPKENEQENQEEVHKNRRHRRLEEQLQRERESNIALNERIKTLAEVKAEQNTNNLDPRLVRVFGESEAGLEIARHMGEILEEKTELAKDKALQEFRNEQLLAEQEQKESELFIDSQLEQLEDEYNIDLTSNAPAARKARNEFLSMVEKLSPKNEQGDLVEYADFGSTFEIYKSNQVKEPTRQKEIASKSLQRSQTSSTDSQTITPGFRGWQKDYQIE